jgi:hypothetical protein
MVFAMYQFQEVPLEFFIKISPHLNEDDCLSRGEKDITLALPTISNTRHVTSFEHPYP